MTERESSTTIALLALMKLRRVGRRKALAIVNQPITEQIPESCQDTLWSRLQRTPTAQVSKDDLAVAWTKSEEQLHRAREIGVQALSFHDPGYPLRLKETPDPPAVLFVKGDAKALHPMNSLAVVGTRKPTSYGKVVAKRSARTAVGEEYVIVSGLAHGCDAYAHEGCLEAEGIGVAVLAHGLDKVYPAANRDLAERLLEHGGCLTSEYAVGTKPARSAFAERDRIQSGLSDAVLVIETDVKGGTMHTVRFARKQSRPIACVNHPTRFLAEDTTRGNQQLIRNRTAHPISNGFDLSDFLKNIDPVTMAATHLQPDKSHDEPQESFVY